MTTLAIVVPCYNEAEVLNETCLRIAGVLQRLQTSGKVSGASRVYFVDDGSTDGTWGMIEALTRRGLPVAGIKLSCNRGHQNALLAGLFTAQGDIVVTIDADLQDDVGMIEQMVEHYERGSDVVYGVRRARGNDTFFKSFSAQAFYRLMALLGAKTVFNHADYRLMSRRAVGALRKYREVNLFLRGIVPLIGFPSSCVYYDRTARFAGQSKYPFKKMCALALNAITSFSIVPLRVITFIGFAVFTFSLLMSAWILWAKIFTDNAVPGWASILLPVYFLGGVQILCLGIVGEYLGKLYAEAKARPRYIIEKMIPDVTAAKKRERAVSLVETADRDVLPKRVVSVG